MIAPGQDSTAGALTGVVVADFSRVLAGPVCTMTLADLGADVIKIERPESGDDTRSWGPPFMPGGDAAYFFSINRNKRSIALDLGDAADRALAREIAMAADVVVENFRPGVMAKFGLDHASLAEAHPGLVYCSIPAFAGGAEGAVPGYDLLMQAITGFMSFTGEPGGEPMKMGVALLDVITGLYASVAVMAALRQKAETGLGGAVTVGLFEASIASLTNQASNYLLGGVVPAAAGTAHPNIVPYQGFRARDGQFVLAAGNDKLYRATCGAIGRPDLANHPSYTTNAGRVDHRAALIDELQALFETETVEHWTSRLQAAGVPAAPVLGLDQVFSTNEALRMVSEIDDPVRGPLRLLRTPIEGEGLLGVRQLAPPRLGEHDEEIKAWVADLRTND